MRKNGYFAIVTWGIFLKKSEVIPLAFKIMDSVKQHLKVKLKGIVFKNIEGNRGKLGAQTSGNTER
ncbi:hypothetical protein PARMER_01102 [Parabacteroides merdae ATCC 43184]|nr:hypothetical protein PARMER_01102 [Parabacteroides merdae ATCC 43184]